VRLLFEHGLGLRDDEGLLEGAGTQTRFVRVAERNDRLATAIGRSVHAAVAQRLFNASGQTWRFASHADYGTGPLVACSAVS
jgi:hypothetical protein